jgi:Carboxypeptidase regulatory-like domain
MSGSKASAALLQAVADAALRIMEDEHCYVATSPSSTPILAEHIATLADPAAFASSPGALAAAVQLSRIVDYVQDGSPVFDWQRVGQDFVSNVYPKIKANVRFARAALSGKELEEFDRAQATLYDDPPWVETAAYAQYAELKVQVQLGRVQLWRLQLELAAADEAEKQAEKKALQERIAAIEEGLEVQEGLLRSLDERHRFEEALRIYQSAQLAGFPKSVEDASAMLGTPLAEIPTPDGVETHVRAVFSPNRIAEENWITVKVGRDQIRAADPANPLVPPPRAGDRVAPLDEEAIESIELDLQVFKVERFWLWDALFGNRLWTWETPDEPVSTGGQPPSGRLPAYTTAVIIARNLRVSGRSRLVDSAAVGSQTPLQLATFRFAAPTVDATGQTLRIAAHGRLLQPIALAQPAAASLAPATASLATGTRAMVLPADTGRLLARFASVNLPVVQGRVVDAEDRPVADATVQSRDLGTGQVMVKTTAQNGEVSFELPAPATHEVTVTKPGCTPSTQQLPLAPGGQFAARLERQLQVQQVLLTRQSLDPSSPFWRGPVKWTRPTIPQPAVLHPLTVSLAKAVADDRQEAMDVPVRVELGDAQGVRQQVVTVDPGKDVAFNLPPGRYQVSASCEVYDATGPSTQSVDLTQAAGAAFAFRPRTILESRELYLLGFVCRRVPKSPDPHPDARW